jgi:hypothetical protein
MKFHHRARKAQSLCCSCKKAPLFQYGRCTACFRVMDPALYARLKKLSRAERKAEFENLTGQPEMPKWLWPGREEELIAEFGEHEDLKLDSAREIQNVGVHEG